MNLVGRRVIQPLTIAFQWYLLCNFYLKISSVAVDMRNTRSRSEAWKTGIGGWDLRAACEFVGSGSILSGGLIRFVDSMSYLSCFCNKILDPPPKQKQKTRQKPTYKKKKNNNNETNPKGGKFVTAACHGGEGMSSWSHSICNQEAESWLEAGWGQCPQVTHFLQQISLIP